MEITLKQEIAPLLLVLILVVMGAYFYAHFPASVAAH
jgi:hypothetical protein